MIVIFRLIWREHVPKKKNIHLFILLVLTITLSACIHNRDNEYLQARSESDLLVPKQLSASKIQDAYPIPEGGAWSENKTPSKLPPGSLAAKQSSVSANQNNVKEAKKLQAITVLGSGSKGNPALLVRRPFSQIWPVFDKALIELNYKLVGKDKRLGTYVVTNVEKTATYQFNLWEVKQGVAIEIKRYPEGGLSHKKINRILQPIQAELNKQLGNK